MKPLNSHTTGCDPVSSNCVIWQGPDIPCIKLCKGDSVSDVVFKLATELCDVLHQLDISTYQLPNACFTSQSCNPGDFHDLIQLIIYKLCCLESGGTDTESCNNASPTSTGSGSRVAATGGGCPDCTVDIAKCFYYTNEFGDEITTMQLTDYTKAIGNRLCMLVNDIFIQSEILNNHEERITALENTPAPTLLLPTVTPTCIISPAIPQPMNVVLSTLEQQFCQLVSATGSPNNIYQSVTRQCLNLGNSPALGTSGGNMSGISGWLITANTLASTINNLWLTVCDLRSAVQNIQLNCCPSGCDGIAITLNAIANPTSMVVYINGTIPAGFQECNPTGNTFTISDSLGNTISVSINTISYLNNPTGYTIDLAGTPINTAANLTITSDVCYVNGSTNTTCQFCLTYNVVNVSICPSITAVPDVFGTGVGVSYFPSVVPASYTVEIWDSGFVAVIATQTTAVTVSTTQLITFSSVLTPSTTYNVRLVINNGGKTTECGFAVFTTNPILCLAPDAVSASVALPIYCDTCGPALDFSDNATVDGTYVDVSSDYLLTYSGGTFNSIYALLYQASAVGTVSPAVYSTRNGATTSSGDTYIAYNDNSSATASKLYHYDSTGTLVNTITLPFSGTPTIICSSIDYSEFDGKIYFVSWTATKKLYQLNPADDSYVELPVISAAIGGAFPNVSINPLNGHVMLSTNVGDTRIGDPATDTVLNVFPNAITQSGLPVVNTNNGYVWVFINGQNAVDIWDVSGVTPVIVGTATAPVGYTFRGGSANGRVRGAIYYPGDGTVGTDRMFAIFDDTVGLTGSYVLEFDANSPYTASTFVTLGVQVSPVSVLYSYAYNKIILTYGITLEGYQPTDGTTPYANVTIGAATNLMWPYEDTVNKQLVYFNMASSPSNNVFWVGLDTTNASQCTEGIVDMYLGDLGPYEYNPTTLSWSAMCTPSAVTISGTTFQANATFTTSVLFGALLYSTDGGVTWNAMIDNSGNLYANPAVWLAGRTYNVPAAFFSLKITFNTNNDCALESTQFFVV